MPSSSVITENNLERRISIGYETPPPVNYSDEGDDRDREFYLGLIYCPKEKRDSLFNICHISMQVFPSEIEYSLNDFFLMSIVHNPNFVSDFTLNDTEEEIKDMEVGEARKYLEVKRKKIEKDYGKDSYNIMEVFYSKISLDSGYKSQAEQATEMKEVLSKENNSFYLWLENKEDKKQKISHKIKLKEIFHGKCVSYSTLDIEEDQ